MSSEAALAFSEAASLVSCEPASLLSVWDEEGEIRLSLTTFMRFSADDNWERCGGCQGGSGTRGRFRTENLPRSEGKIA